MLCVDFNVVNKLSRKRCLIACNGTCYLSCEKSDQKTSSSWVFNQKLFQSHRLCRTRGRVGQWVKFTEHRFHYPAIHSCRTWCWHAFHTFFRELLRKKTIRFKRNCNRKLGSMCLLQGLPFRTLAASFASQIFRKEDKRHLRSLSIIVDVTGNWERHKHKNNDAYKLSKNTKRPCGGVGEMQFSECEQILNDRNLVFHLCLVSEACLKRNVVMMMASIVCHTWIFIT